MGSCLLVEESCLLRTYFFCLFRCVASNEKGEIFTSSKFTFFSIKRTNWDLLNMFG